MTESGQRPLKILTSLQGIKDMLDKHTEKNTDKGGNRGGERGREKKTEKGEKRERERKVDRQQVRAEDRRCRQSGRLDSELNKGHNLLWQTR